jgi:MFS family permease
LFVLTLVTGWTADRIDRRHIARASIALEMFCAVVLGTLAWTESTTLPALFAVAALLGVARAFAGPALGALAPNLVPREILPRAIAMSSIAWQSGAIAGPALGGYLYASAPFLPYAVSGGLFALSLLCMVMIRPIPRTAITGSRHPWTQMIDGLRYVRENRLVLGAISLDLFAVLLGGATALLPIYAREILHTGPWGLGVLRSAPAIGALLMTVVLARHAINRRMGLRMFQAVIVFGAATVVFALSPWILLSVAALAIMGAADTVSVVIRVTLVQLATPDDMRGRVGAVNFLFINASNQLGEFESGATAALLGAMPAAVLGGVGTIIVALLWMKLFPQLRHVDRLE